MATTRSVSRTTVTFAGERGGEGPLSNGQQSTAFWVEDTAGAHRMVHWVLEPPAGTTVDDVAEVMSILLARHESLRTTYPGERITRQRIQRSGEFSIEQYELDPASAVDSASLTPEMIQDLRTRGFELARDLPLRVAVATRDGFAVVVVIVYSHMAVDFIAMSVVGREFDRLLADRSAPLRPPARQPLDQARWDRSPRGERQLDAALRYWDTHRRTMPSRMCALPRPERPGHCHRGGFLRSPAAGLALTHIRSRTGATPQMTVVAALYAVLGHWLGHPRCVFPILSSNRFHTELRGYVGTLAQDGLVAIDVTEPDFDTLVRRTGAAVLTACRHSQLDHVRHHAMTGPIEDRRGVVFVRDCAINDLTASGTQLTGEPVTERLRGDAAAALPLTGLRWADLSGVSEVLLFELIRTDGVLVLGLTADTDRVPVEDVEALLRGIERLVVAASTGTVDLCRIGELTGVRPVARGSEWRRVDSCLIDLDEVEALVRRATGIADARVFAVPDRSEPQSLVAFLPAGLAAIDPVRAHAACMAALKDAHAAMTPHRYVVCDGAPAEPSDVDDWRRRPVLLQGSGRSNPSAR